MSSKTTSNNFKIIEIKNKERYNRFVKGIKHAEFLQSWQWGEFQEEAGNKVIRVGVEENGSLRAVATLIKKNIALGKSYFFSPRGPVIDSELTTPNPSFKQGGETLNSSPSFQGGDRGGLIDFLFSEIEKIAKKEGVIFYRFEPTCAGTICPFAIKSAVDIEPKDTIMLDLSVSEDELLSAMHQKTRYNIRLSERKGVKVKEARVVERFDDFWNVMTMTCNRDCFRTHSYEYYRKMLEIDDCFIKLYIAELNGKLLSAGIFSFFGDTATYIHGASSDEEREAMAPYQLQWHVIKTAKQGGIKYYDFYGIDEKKWPGVTRFKRGFKGEERNYPGTFDMVFNKTFYNIYTIGRKIRRKI